jgi:predicted peptidase
MVGTPADMAVAALQQTMREFHVDPKRLSHRALVGGHGTWYVAYRHAELFAAIVPICGWVPLPQFRGSVPVVPGDSASVMTSLAQRLRSVPIWIFHGEVDRVVNVTGSREPATQLKAAGANVLYTELLGLDHNSWDATYGSEEFARWLFAQQRR